MNTYKVKVRYSNGMQYIDIEGKDFITAFTKFYKAEAKGFRYIIGFDLIKANDHEYKETR